MPTSNRSAADPKALHLAFVNTRMPGFSFLARDLVALAGLGVRVDLYVLDPESIVAELRRPLEAAGGSVRKIDFPFSSGIAAALTSELARHPLRLLGSLRAIAGVMLRDFREGARALGVLGPSIALGRRIRESGAVQAHGLWAGVPTTIAFWMHRHCGVPYSFSGHAYDLNYQVQMLALKAKAARGVVVCSEFAKKKLGSLVGPESAARVRVVHHGLDLEDWAERESPEPPPSPPLVLAVGRMTEKKGYHHLVDAAALLRDRGVSFSCRIVGPDFGQAAELARCIERHRLRPMVALAGELPIAEVAAYMRRAAVLAVPSIQDRHGDSDGIPNVVLEAMALGLPVVSTHAGGLAEVVRDGETGLVIPEADPPALSRALERVLAGQVDLPAIRRRARALVQAEFSLDRTSRSFLQGIGQAPPPGPASPPAR